MYIPPTTSPPHPREKYAKLKQDYLMLYRNLPLQCGSVRRVEQKQRKCVFSDN